LRVSPAHTLLTHTHKTMCESAKCVKRERKPYRLRPHMPPSPPLRGSRNLLRLSKLPALIQRVRPLHPRPLLQLIPALVKDS